MISPASSAAPFELAQAQSGAASGPEPPDIDPNDRSREADELFNRFVGTTFYSLMLKEMRKSVGKTPYFHGGRTEEVFTAQLDQQLAEKLADVNGSIFSSPLMEVSQLARR